MVRTGFAFVVALGCAVAVFETAARRRISGVGGANIIGLEVYEAVARARTPGPAVERILLGDSVARQFFPDGREPHPRVRFLTSNALITIAGNYYLLADALTACPNVRDVVLLIRPEVLRLDPLMYTSDYFSAFFHSPAQIAELWRVKHDLRLTGSQMARWLLPGSLAVNSAWRQLPRGFQPPGPTLLRQSGEGVPDIQLGIVARYFLPRMRAMVEGRGGRLRVISVPLPDEQRWKDPLHLLSDPITYVDRAFVGDGIHLGPAAGGVRSCAGTAFARLFAEAHGIVDALPVTPSTPNDTCEDRARPFRIVDPGKPHTR